MRKIFTLLLLPALLLAACANDDGDNMRIGEGLKINISCGAMTTRADKPGVDDLNENKLNSAWVFLFADGALNGDGTAQATYWEQVQLNGANGSAQFTINPLLNEVNGKIFPNGATNCDIFVIANYHGSETFATAPTLNSLRSLEVEADFKGNDPGTSISTNNYKKQDDFVMTGSGTMTLNRNTSPFTGSCNINLQRLASKIELSIHVSQEIVGDNTTWEPYYDNITVQIMNARNKGHLNGTKSNATDGKFDFYQRYGTAGTLDGETRASVGPFYSYANSWTEPFDDESTYALITVPFSKKEDTSKTYTTFKYKVRLLSDKLEPNKWYTQRVNISLLGSVHQGEVIPEITDNTFSVKDWATVSTNVKIKDNRFLDITYSGDDRVVTTNKYNKKFGIDGDETIPVVMVDNLDEVAITYASSPAIKVTSIQRSFYDFSGSQAAPKTGTATVPSTKDTYSAKFNGATGAVANDGDREVSVSVGNDKITVHHTLKNMLNDSTTVYDVSAFYLKIHVRHADKNDDNTQGTYDDIYIVQKPAISIEAEYTGNTYATSGACVSVNNGQNQNIGTNGSNNGTNTNWNQYVITISRLNPQSTYILADPRVDRENASSFYSASTSAKEITGVDQDGKAIISNGTRKLKYYRETKVGSTDEEKNLIAPAYRFASSHGTTENITQQNAKYRCATYQENGYPAGRWRVPTVAEIRFAMSLSANGMIPYLFGSDGGLLSYWVASGLVTINRSVTPATVKEKGSGTEHPVRCVYDEWYWNDKLDDTQKTTFTWGDRQ